MKSLCARKKQTTLKLSMREARRRRNSTFQAALKLHGESPEETEPVEFGLLDTVVSKCDAGLVAEKIMNSKKIMKEVTSKTKKKLKNYEESEEKKIRSVAVYYSGVSWEKGNTARSIGKCVLNIML